MGRFAIASGVVAFALGLGAAPAFAGTAAVTFGYEFGDSSVSYAASPGEHNDMTVTANDESVTFDDTGTGVEVRAGRGCDQIGPHTARCYPRTDQVLTSVNADDEDDVVRLISGPGAVGSFSASGGSGDDRLEAASVGSSLDGGDGADELVGGAGGDSLTGGPGADLLTGGGGNDGLTPDGDGAAPATDVVDGGAGRDSVSYAERSTPVDVDLTRAEGNGGPGENDTIRGVEAVLSGRGSDVLRGDSQANVLTSSAGTGTHAPEHDVVDGRDGNDVITGSYGADVLSGGPGDDAIDASGGADSLSGGAGDDSIDLLDAQPRSVRCGPGEDFLSYPRPRMLILPECETVQDENLFFIVRTHMARPRPGVRTVGFSWFSGFPSLPCRMVALLSRPGHRRGELGRGAVRVHGSRRVAGEEQIATRLTPLGRRVFRARAARPVHLTLEAQTTCDAAGRRDPTVGGFTTLTR